MNIKQIAAGVVATGVMLSSVALPALASDPSLTVSNWAKVKNKVVTKSNTGHNYISAYDDVEGGEIRTGRATSQAEVSNFVNWTELGCGCLLGLDDDTSITVDNGAKVYNKVFTKSNTGHNYISANDDVEGGLIVTGDASSTSVVTNDVNTTLLGSSAE